MDLVAKRKIADTWREAVARRAAPSGLEDACLATFDDLVAAGRTDTEAAYRALAAVGLLWTIEGPGDAAAPSTSAPVGRPGSRHDLPNV